jgi:hypothetical protein
MRCMAQHAEGNGRGGGGWRRLVSVAVPFFVVAIPRKQIGIPRRRAEPFDEIIELDELLRVLPNGAVQKRCLIFQLDDRLAAQGEQAMLGLPAQPVAEAHFIFCPSEDRFLLEAPDVEHVERLAHVMVRRPKPEDAILVCDAGNLEFANLLNRHLRVWMRAAMRWIVLALFIRPWIVKRRRGRSTSAQVSRKSSFVRSPVTSKACTARRDSLLSTAPTARHHVATSSGSSRDVLRASGFQPRASASVGVLCIIGEPSGRAGRTACARWQTARKTRMVPLASETERLKSASYRRRTICVVTSVIGLSRQSDKWRRIWARYFAAVDARMFLAAI